MHPKLRREFSRFKQRLLSRLSWLYAPLQTRRYDARVLPYLAFDSGAVPLDVAGVDFTNHPKVALFLIYQPSGVAESVVHTLRYLVGNGYAPLVVSNAPLSEADLARIAAQAWRVVVRPNFGYDFGGYRDGVLCLHRWGVVPSCCLILNDSMWFPLHLDSDYLRCMEAQPFALVGAEEHADNRLPQYQVSQNEARVRRPFMSSFLMLVKSSAWQHPAFLRYWQNYRLTNNKYDVVRQGEIGFSMVWADVGLPCGYMVSRRDFDAYVAQASHTQLCEVLADLLPCHQGLEREIALCLASFEVTKAWGDRARYLAFRATERRSVVSNAPMTALGRLAVPFIKKGNSLASRAIQQRILQMHSDMGIGIDSCIIAELRLRINN